MAESKNKLMYTDKEIDLIKSVFSENEFLMLAIRKLFFGAEVTAEEKDLIVKTFKGKEIKEVFRKKVYGLNNFSTPVGQISDFWMGAEMQIFGASRDTVLQVVESKGLVLEMFEQAFDLLDNPDGKRVSIQYDPNSVAIDPLGVKLIARNLYMKAIETALLTVLSIAGLKTETTAQTLERLQKDSSK